MQYTNQNHHCRAEKLTDSAGTLKLRVALRSNGRLLIFKVKLSVTASVNSALRAGFDARPVLDLRDPNFTVEGNRLLAELRAKGSLCRVEPLGVLGLLRWMSDAQTRYKFYL
ncbi:MAG TPA: hypothetical protein VK673_09295 [Chthoniobacterales bacterium]|nr:hypothetical protein [Chthoniobacterales bacterium]